MKTVLAAAVALSALTGTALAQEVPGYGYGVATPADSTRTVPVGNPDPVTTSSTDVTERTAQPRFRWNENGQGVPNPQGPAFNGSDAAYGSVDSVVTSATKDERTQAAPRFRWSAN